MSMRASLVALSIAAATSIAGAAETEIDLVGLDFIVADVTIDVGDTVTWTWVNGFHNVVSADGAFSSGPPVNSPGTTFSVTFDQAFLDANPVPGDIYVYHCEVHLTFGMVGSVTVNTDPMCVPKDCDDANDCTVDHCTDGTCENVSVDLDGGGDVGVPDLLALLSMWDLANPDGDFDRNGTVGIGDLLVLLSLWGACP